MAFFHGSSDWTVRVNISPSTVATGCQERVNEAEAQSRLTTEVQEKCGSPERLVALREKIRLLTDAWNSDR
jgi:hypothetical protein